MCRLLHAGPVLVVEVPDDTNITGAQHLPLLLSRAFIICFCFLQHLRLLMMQRALWNDWPFRQALCA
jgi:hypothetical protein